MVEYRFAIGITYPWFTNTNGLRSLSSICYLTNTNIRFSIQISIVIKSIRNTMDTEAHKFHISGEYFQNFPSADIISPEHYVITTNSDTNSLDWNVSSPSHNQSADCHQEIPSELLCFVEVFDRFLFCHHEYSSNWNYDAAVCSLQNIKVSTVINRKYFRYCIIGPWILMLTILSGTYTCINRNYLDPT